ncbi:MAG: PilN domain-containing protein [Candidatus Paceibacterota bacterium]
MKKGVLEINLLPKKEKKLQEKFLYFLLNYFRYIIVLTQIVVISVFFFRFYIDQQIIDRKEVFNQKQQILVITAPLIEEAQALERKTTYAKDIISKQQDYIDTIKFILASVHSQAALESFIQEGSVITLKGNSLTIPAIRSMQARLAQSERFSQVEVENVVRLSDLSFDFSITISLKANEEG